MNIEHMKETVETILERKIDDTVWDRFACGETWRSAVTDLLGRLFLAAEGDTIRTLSEIGGDEAEVEG